MATPAMPVFDADPTELRDALQRVRAAVFALDEPRRWYAALVLAVMVRTGQLEEWRDWRVEPQRGSNISVTPATMACIERLFSTPTAALLRTPQPNGVVQYMRDPATVIVDPLRQLGKGGGASELLCVVTPDRRRFDVPIDDPGWIWNADAPAHWSSPDSAAPEYKPSGDYQQQQGVHCGWPADALFGEGADRAASIMATPRPDCVHRLAVKREVRVKSGATGPPQVADQWVCEFNDRQCAMKEAGSPTVGGPRALVPDAAGSDRLLLTPESFERILDDANASGAALPRIADFALVVSYLGKGSGKALDFNRVHDLIAPEHAVLLLEHR